MWNDKVCKRCCCTRAAVSYNFCVSASNKMPRKTARGSGGLVCCMKNSLQMCPLRFAGATREHVTDIFNFITYICLFPFCFCCLFLASTSLEALGWCCPYFLFCSMSKQRTNLPKTKIDPVPIALLTLSIFFLLFLSCTEYNWTQIR